MEDEEGKVTHIFGGHYILEWLFSKPLSSVFSGFQSTHNQYLDYNMDIQASHGMAIAALMASGPLLPLVSAS